MTMMMKLYGKSKRTAKAQRRAVLQWVRGAHATLRREKKNSVLGRVLSGVCRRTFSFSFFFSLKPLARGRRREKKGEARLFFLPSFLPSFSLCYSLNKVYLVVYWLSMITIPHTFRLVVMGSKLSICAVIRSLTWLRLFLIRGFYFSVNSRAIFFYKRPLCFSAYQSIRHGYGNSYISNTKQQQAKKPMIQLHLEVK